MYMDDPADKKPEDWEEEEMIVDKEATKPEDWDEAKEGEWKPPKTKNPNYKGPWAPKKIYNQNFKGVWKPKMIPNPEYKDIPMESYNIGGMGFDVWQVKAGTIFDNVMIADNLEEALSEARTILEKQVEAENKFKVAFEEEQAKQAQSKMKEQAEASPEQKGEEKEDL
jgi:calreticulin